MTMPVIPGKDASRKKAGRHSGAGSVKMLLTAASVAALMGGWAVLTVHSSPGGSEQSVEPTMQVETLRVKLLPLPPLPTLLPPPAGLPVGGRPVGSVPQAPGSSFPRPVQMVASTPVAPKVAAGGRTEKDAVGSKAPKKAKPDPVAKTSSSK